MFIFCFKGHFKNISFFCSFLYISIYNMQRNFIFISFSQLYKIMIIIKTLIILIFSYVPTEAGYILLALILIFTSLFNLPRFFELNTLSLPECNYVTVEPTPLRLSPTYSTITMVSSVMFFNIIPFICLIFINKQIYSVIQQKIKILETLNKRKVFMFT